MFKIITESRMRNIISLFILVLLSLQIKAQDCSTSTVNCTANGGKEWIITLAPGATLNLGGLVPATAWTVSQIGTNPDVWSIYGVDPDPANILNLAGGAWNVTGPCDQTNFVVEVDCIIDNCPNCNNPPCNITASIPTNIQCQNNGTPSDPTDDTFTFNITLNESSGGTSWTSNDPLGTNGTYGSILTLGPYNIVDGDLNFTVTDSDDMGCTTQIMVTAPATCSNGATCDIVASIPSNIQCSDNNTPSDPSDDTFTFDLSINETNGGTNWTAGDPLGSTGIYSNLFITMGPYAISNGSFSFVITDSNDQSCTEVVAVNAPLPCSTVTTCDLTITSTVSGLCQDNNTPFDPSDDFFEVIVDASVIDGSVSNQFEVSDGTNTFGPFIYGTGGTISIPADGTNYTLTYSDIDNPNCIATTDVSRENCCQINMSSTTVNVTNTTIDDGEIQLCMNSGLAPYVISIVPATGSIYEVPGTCLANFVIAGLGEGTYNVVVTDAQGCETILNDLDIDGPNCTDFQLSDVVSTPVTCPGATDGTMTFNLYDAGNASSITVDVGNGVPPVTFTELGDPLFMSNLPPGTYDVSLFDNNGCEVTFLFNPLVINDVDPITYEATVTSATAIGGDDGSILLCLEGGNGSFNASIVPDTGMVVTGVTGCLSGEGILISDLPADDYQVTVLDVNDCPLVIDFIVNDPTCDFEVNVLGVTDVICAGENTGSITVNAVGGTGPYSVSIDGGLTFTNPQAVPVFGISDLESGSYSVIVMDANGCQVAFDNPIVIEENPMITLDTEVTHVNFFNGSNGNIFMCVNGGVAPYNVTVSPNNGNLVPGSTSTDCEFNYNLSALPGGVYEITVTDNLGCSETFEAEVLTPTCATFAILDTAVTNVSCYGANTGSIEVTVLGGTAPFTYSLSGVQPFVTSNTTFTFEGLDNGEYDLIVTDNAGCMFPFPNPIMVVEPEALFSTVSSIPACAGQDNGVICLLPENGTPDYMYNVLNEDDEEQTVIPGPHPECDADFHVTPVEAGTYFVELIDENGCKAHGIHTVTETEVLTGVEVTPDCTGAAAGSIDLTISTPNTPVTYNWDNGETTEDLENLEDGTYQVTVTDSRGCTGVNSGTVEISDMELGFDIAETCIEQNAGAVITSITNGVPVYDLNWTGNGTSGSEDNNSSNAISVSDLGVGDYSITVTDVRGCTASGTTTVTEYDMTSEMVAGDACLGQQNGFVGATPMSGIPNYTYLWSNGSIEGVVNDLAAGTYTVTITDVNGCTATGQETVEEYELIPSFETSNVCSGTTTGAIVVNLENAYGNIDYQWSNNGSGNPLGNVGAGTYTVTATDDLGCSVTGSATIEEFDSPTATASGDATIELGESTGVSVDANGGTSPYTYVWSPGSIENPTSSSTQVTPETTTTYSIEVTDANGCMAFDTVLVIVIPPVIISIPNAFSPNGDEKNDLFELFIPNMDAEVQTFQIFDRWGELLHDDPTTGWDGQFRGKDQPVGTYVYLVEYFDALNRKATLKGHFSLIR